MSKATNMLYDTYYIHYNIIEGTQNIIRWDHNKRTERKMFPILIFKKKKTIFLCYYKMDYRNL